MEEERSLDLYTLGIRRTARELEACNGYTARFGLALTPEQALSLAERRSAALRATGRLEFGGGVLEKLVMAFADSPYLDREGYEGALEELQDAFYYFKNESRDRIPDDELIAYMRRVFDGKAQGSLEYLSGTSLEELCRDARQGVDDGWR